MKLGIGAALIAAGWLVCTGSAAGTAPPIEAFARIPNVRGVSISPNGSQVALITSSGDRSVVVTYSRAAPEPRYVPVLRSEPGDYEISWCGWANEKRLLCGLRAMAVEMGRVYPYSRLAAVDADGGNLKVLLRRSGGVAQFQDRILDWTPDEPDSVLIQLDEDGNGYPGVFSLDVHKGQLTKVTRERPPIRTYRTDAKGNVRLGWGYANGSTDISYYARIEGEREWKLLSKVKAFQASDSLEPIAVTPGKNIAYATGLYEGRSALWEMDLTDQREPQLVFSHPLVDADDPLLTQDGRLLGIWYELDRPFVYYTDEYTRALIKGVNQVEKSKFSVLIDSTLDEKTFVVLSYSDVDGGTYSILDTQRGALTLIGTQYPGLDPASLGRMRSIAYKASDGTEIPGYLTVPPGIKAENLPLIVMPHGGPIARDSWEFDFLRAFLVSRGYAVLQMNFRGSSGYGSEWYHAAHQDWGGLTYSDITDAARWAVAEGIADPERMCIVGWSFGGYAALLGAVRNNDLYRCSVSIAGVSDLNMLLSDARFFTNWRFAREQIGVDKEKLRNDSPLRLVDRIGIPVLLIHGDRDYQVEVDHSKKMEAALAKADKPHRAVFLKNATHQLERQSDRETLLTEIERFLQENLRKSEQRTADGGQ